MLTRYCLLLCSPSCHAQIPDTSQAQGSKEPSGAYRAYITGTTTLAESAPGSFWYLNVAEIAPRVGPTPAPTPAPTVKAKPTAAPVTTQQPTAGERQAYYWLTRCIAGLCFRNATFVLCSSYCSQCACVMIDQPRIIRHWDSFSRKIRAGSTAIACILSLTSCRLYFPLLDPWRVCCRIFNRNSRQRG